MAAAAGAAGAAAGIGRALAAAVMRGMCLGTRLRLLTAQGMCAADTAMRAGGWI
jgi:hypothetical protein